MNYPSMIGEIIEAIHLMYEDYPDVEADCYLCLTGFESDKELAMRASIGAQVALEKMNRCGICGEELQTYHYKEPHPELDGCPMEDKTEVYCPHCDVGGDGYH